MYNKKFPVDPPPAGQTFDLDILQFDDYGSLWTPEDADKIINKVKDTSKSQNTYVIVFIHGWHNNAAPDNKNLQGFRETLQHIDRELAAAHRSARRMSVTNSADYKLIGVYIGWRGRSLPGIADYATAWGRKAAAERAGEGDVSEFLERLQRLYLRANEYEAKSQSQGKVARPFMGLVSIGHSFGAQVLLKSVGRTLEYALAERAEVTANVLDPDEDPKQATTVRTPIDSLGDLNILLNPALEAYQFGRIDALYQQLNFGNEQTPQLIAFSADNDYARKILFPLERAVTSPFRPSFRGENDGYQGTLWGHALGEVERQQTHILRRVNDMPDSLSDESFIDSEGALVRQYDFTSQTVFNNIQLIPDVDVGIGGAKRIPNSPVMVIQAQDKIIDGHNGIFHDDFQVFLARYVAYVEGKRVLLRHEKFKRMDASAQMAQPY